LVDIHAVLEDKQEIGRFNYLPEHGQHPLLPNFTFYLQSFFKSAKGFSLPNEYTETINVKGDWR
jgi:hypothetical protein